MTAQWPIQTAVSRYETRPSLTRVGEAPPALPTAPLDWTTPSCTLPRVPTRKGGPTRGGSPLRPRPSSGQRRKHLGSQHNGAHRPPWNKTRQPTGRVSTQRARRHRPPQQPGPPALPRANNQAPPSIIDPRGNPARAPIERGAASAAPDQDGKDAKAPPWAPDSRSLYAHPAGILRQRQTVAHQRKANTARPAAALAAKQWQTDCYDMASTIETWWTPRPHANSTTAFASITIPPPC
ncbi:hypothetical protein WOLCODRAFT_158027 [Wolfiporia cocos MD-104 SS10]|uniref:Uncharacterized protein n=1 Tax=Wolfiporia cocos (strain MD-104) TaxID=742152 RepID=A0A2H3J534_WOLCO|nr:hypothetical protein WOLCODRAFT_158027 [Wolfiporia cocos MD-104 SS10]